MSLAEDNSEEIQPLIEIPPIELDDLLIKRINNRAKEEARFLTRQSAKEIVACYYNLQEVRVGMGNRTFSKDDEDWVSKYLTTELSVVETHMKSILAAWTDAIPITSWAKQVVGIGPVISAGLHAHIDIEKAKTHGAVWRFAGLDPSSVWEKGQKRPYNAALKVLAWKAGESFIKVSGKPTSLYGRLYKEKKVELEQQNDDGFFSTYAADFIAAGQRVPGKGTDARKALDAGRLPQAQVHARARRYAVKIFLSHYHECEYRMHYGIEAPLPYALAHLDHAHKIDPEVPYPAL